MRKVILDTDILSEVFKQRNEAVMSRAEAYLCSHEALTFTSISASELLFGLYAKDAKQQIAKARRFLKAHEEMVPTSEEYWLVARINAELRRAGRPIGNADPLIAACAINSGHALATGNVKHYRFVIDAGFGLELENWASP